MAGNYTCGATKFSTFTPSRSSMISAIHLPVAVGVVALVAEQADRAGFLHQRRQFVELFPGLRRFQVL